MKKISFFALVFLGLIGSTYAQEGGGSEFKPSAKSVTVEMNLNFANLGLFHASSGSPLGLNNGAFQLRGRYFLSETMAIRGGLNITSQSMKKNYAEKPDGTGAEGNSKQSYFMLGLRPGIEKHFKGTDRLSTYVGADLIINMASASEKWEKYDGTSYNADVSAEIKGSWSDGARNASTGFGLNAVVGADYYFMKKVYIGAEFGWGFTATSNKKVEQTVKSTGTPDAVTITPKSGQFDLTPNIVSGFRLGFMF